LRHALEAPDRIDPLLIERAAHPATERLHVLAAEEPLTEQWTHRIGGGRALAVALRQRYNFVLADIPAHPLGFAGEILALAQQRILIIEARAQSVHLAKSWMALPAGAMQTSRPVLVVNKYQKRRGLTAAQIEAELSTPVAVTVPDMGPHAARAADLGESLIAAKGKFRDAILQLARIIGAAPGGPA
jgi:pilus assembly protein CpaE